jgi:hypothetical protein
MQTKVYVSDVPAWVQRSVILGDVAIAELRG